MTSWVLIRGLTREAAHWGEFPKQLTDVLPETRVIAVDLPGAGRLHRRSSPLRILDMIPPCLDQLHELQAAPPYVLVGLSLGGMVAAAWASSRPEELAGCVLVNSSMRPFSPLRSRLRPSHWPALLDLMVSADGLQAERAILRLTSSRPEHHLPVLANWAAIRRLRPVSNFNAMRQLLAAARYRFDGPAPLVPTLIVSSCNDQLVDPVCSDALARQWGSEQLIHPDAGHDLPLDDSPWLAGRLAEWSVRRCARAANAASGSGSAEDLR